MEEAGAAEQQRVSSGKLSTRIPTLFHKFSRSFPEILEEFSQVLQKVPGRAKCNRVKTEQPQQVSVEVPPVAPGPHHHCSSA
ncbi:hypothetical protein GN956_G1136 [Arapaima gigas]